MFFEKKKRSFHALPFAVRRVLVCALIVSAAFVFSVSVQYSYQARALIPTFFVLAVYSIGWFYSETVGIACAFLVSLVSEVVPILYDRETINIAMVSVAALLAVSAVVNERKLKRSAEQLAEQERMRSNLLRAVSHDLRTPLTTISGSGTMMLENWELLTDEQKKQMLGSMTEETEWLSHMTENLLSITRIDRGDVMVYKKPVVAEELADTVLSRFLRRYPEANVRTVLEEDFLLIPMDASLITQVLTNLLENAMIHSGGTEMTLRVRRQGDCVAFSVEDNGQGIPDELLDTLFKRSVPSGIGRPADGKRSGLGIGLTACAAIVRAHNGEISAKNREQGGAVFTFTLPLEEEKA